MCAFTLPPTSPDVFVAHRTASFTIRWPAPSTAIIEVSGDVDAANADAVVTAAFPQTAELARLVLDLRGVEFLGSAGYFALRALNERCAAEAVRWVVVAGDPARRLLRICDPDGSLPVQPTLGAALSAVGPSPLFELVAELR